MICSVDASEAAGGIVAAHLGEGGENVSCELGHRARRVRHGPVRLLNPTEASLKHIGYDLDGEPESEGMDVAAPAAASAASSIKVVLATDTVAGAEVVVPTTTEAPTSVATPVAGAMAPTTTGAIASASGA